jgi:hypothetical protein
LAIAAKLPGFDASAGTAAQPAPNCSPPPVAAPAAADACIAGAIDGAGAEAGAGALAVVAPPPQAERETAPTAAAMMAADLNERMVKSFQE